MCLSRKNWPKNWRISGKMFWWLTKEKMTQNSLQQATLMSKMKYEKILWSICKKSRKRTNGQWNSKFTGPPLRRRVQICSRGHCERMVWGHENVIEKLNIKKFHKTSSYHTDCQVKLNEYGNFRVQNSHAFSSCKFTRFFFIRNWY